MLMPFCNGVVLAFPMIEYESWNFRTASSATVMFDPERERIVSECAMVDCEGFGPHAALWIEDVAVLVMTAERVDVARWSC